MKRKRFNEEQIIAILKEAEAHAALHGAFGAGLLRSTRPDPLFRFLGIAAPPPLPVIPSQYKWQQRSTQAEGLGDFGQ